MITSGFDKSNPCIKWIPIHFIRWLGRLLIKTTRLKASMICKNHAQDIIKKEKIIKIEIQLIIN